MAVTFQQYLNYLQTSPILRPRVKLEFLRADETVDTVITEDILSGNLVINRNNGTRRTVNVEFKNTNGYFNPDRYRVWINKKFKLYLGYNINGEDFLLPQGVFVLDNPSYSSSPSGCTATISGSDKFILLNGETGNGIFNDIYEIPVNSNTLTAIRNLLTIFKDPKSPILQDTSTLTPYTFRKNIGDNCGDMLNEFAYMLSRNIYYDVEGRFNYKDDVDDNIKQSLHDFNYGYDKYSYLGSNYEGRFADVRNVVKVIGNNNTGTNVSFTAKNTNLLSPTNIYVDGIGEKSFTPQFRTELSTVAQCQALAEYILKRVNALNASVTIESVPMFHLDVDEIITLTDKFYQFQKQRFLINSINIDLKIGGTMSIDCVRSDEVDIGEQKASV